MTRLTESQPALQRTQRMAAATANGLMSEWGGSFPMGPWAVTGTILEIAAEPLAVSATVLFQDREHRFQPRPPGLSNPVRLLAGKPAGKAKALAVSIPNPQMRLVLPGRLASKPARFRRWSGLAAPVLYAVGLKPRDSRRRSAETIEPAAGPTEKSLVTRPFGKRDCRLAPARDLAALPPYAAAGENAHSWREQEISGFTWHGGVRIPATQLAPLGAPAPAPQEVNDGWDEIWAAVEASPLGALVAATHYQTVEPANLKCGLRAAAAPQLPVFPLPTGPARRRIDTASSPNLLYVTVLERVEILEAAGVAAPLQTSISALDSAAAHHTPHWNLNWQLLSLAGQDAVLAVPGPKAAGGERRGLWDSDWATNTPRPTPPEQRRLMEPGQFPSAAAVDLPTLTAAQAGVSPRADLQWVSPAIAEARPASYPGKPVGEFARPGQVHHDLRPDPADCGRAPYGPQSLLTGIVLRQPRITPALIRRYGSAGCVPLAAPQSANLPCGAAAAISSDLCPETVLPSRKKPLLARSLRTLPVRLYRIRSAQPMARPADGRPLIMGMDSWASAPAICPSGLRPSSRKRSESKSPALRFGDELRQLFSKIEVQDVWRKAGHLPSDLKWIAMVMPLVIGIWVFARPSSSETGSPAPIAAQSVPDNPVENTPEIRDNQAAALKPVASIPVEVERPQTAKTNASAKITPAVQNGAWGAFTARIAGRASVDLIEDFRNGLSAWEGRGEWARSWSYDRTGTVRPGNLAFFQPSSGLRDYVFEMKASTERRSIQWMVRASGPQNYHFTRLNVTPGAPLTKLELERWSVVNGRTGKVTRLPLPHGGANQTLYSIRVEVHGDSVTTYLQDQVVDTFNDSRLPEGGIALLGTPDDRPRIYGIHVYHQNDFLGKLCSFLVPQPINSQGSD